MYITQFQYCVYNWSITLFTFMITWLLSFHQNLIFWQQNKCDMWISTALTRLSMAWVAHKAKLNESTEMTIIPFNGIFFFAQSDWAKISENHNKENCTRNKISKGDTQKKCYWKFFFVSWHFGRIERDMQIFLCLFLLLLSNRNVQKLKIHCIINLNSALISFMNKRQTRL